MMEKRQDSSRFAQPTIKVDPRDNVAIVVEPEGLRRGQRTGDGITALENIPQGHKIALGDLAGSDPVVRYGEIIGYALKPVAKGSWVNESILRMPDPRPLADMTVAGRQAPVLEPLEGYTFEGYRNKDGSVGTRNILAISTSVQCVAPVADHIAGRIKAELLPRYPNVDDVITINHLYGCGVAIDAPAAVIPIRTLQNLERNPNLGGEVLLLGLGCEKLLPQRLLPAGYESDETVISMQNEELVGFESIEGAILALAEKKLARLNRRKRETCPASELTVGVQCGGSDAFSGVTANPAVGIAADMLVRAGGTVILSAADNS